jgi:UDP-glucuronate decarboxylase
MAGTYVETDISEIAQRISDRVASFAGARILLSGGAGFLGGYFIETLRYLNAHTLREPCRVVVADNLITASNEWLLTLDDPHVQFVQHDVIQRPAGPVFEEPFDYVIHAAGIASPFYYRKFPLETLEVATTGTKNLLELCLRNRPRAFLFFSSSEIYGDPDPQHVPTPESYRGNVSCTGPRACYDEAKRVGETLCTIFHQREGLPTKIVRPFNVYGPGMRRTDYRVVPNFVSKIIDGQPVSIYSEGRQTRTFCYIVDAIAGFLQVLLEGVPGEAYNVGTPTPEVSMRQLVEELERVVRRPVAYRCIEYPDSYPGDEPQRRCPDISKAMFQVGYQPKISLHEGLSRFMRWAEVAYAAPEGPKAHEVPVR